MSGPRSLGWAPIMRDVPGRPTGYAGGENERNWKAAVRDAFAGVTTIGPGRIRIDVDFVLGTDQQGHREPDLDNLIKSTIDALTEVLGRRPGTGSRVEADDVRVNRIVASKRPSRAGEHPGARIVISELPEDPSPASGTGKIGGDSAGGEP